MSHDDKAVLEAKCKIYEHDFIFKEAIKKTKKIIYLSFVEELIQKMAESCLKKRAMLFLLPILKVPY